MASKFLKKHKIPDGFQEILRQFTTEILREQCEDIIEFGAKYFEGLNGGVVYTNNSKTSKKDKKKMEMFNQQGSSVEKNQRMRVKGTLCVNILRGQNMIIDEQIASTQVIAYLSMNPEQQIKTDVIEDQVDPEYNTYEKLQLLMEEEEFINCELVMEVYDMSGIKQMIGQTTIELLEIFNNPNNKYEIEAPLESVNNNDSLTNNNARIYLELEWNSEEQTMELQSINSQARNQSTNRVTGELFIDINQLILDNINLNPQLSCLTFLSHQPHHLIKAQIDNEGNLNTSDKFYLNFDDTNEIYDTRLVFQIFFNDNSLLAEGQLGLLDLMQQPGENQQLIIQLVDPEQFKENGSVNIQIMWAPEQY